MPESLSDRYAELLSGNYDCADRIVLNSYFRIGHTAGGFRVWWRALTGSEETLDNAHLMLPQRACWQPIWIIDLSFMDPTVRELPKDEKIVLREIRFLTF
jgi:hypothetical protein